MRFLTWLIAAPVAVLIVAFAVANRGLTEINLSPFPFIIDIPIWSVAVGAVLFGIIVGSCARWINDHRRRVITNSQAKKLRDAQKEILHLREKLSSFINTNVSRDNSDNKLK